MYTVYILNSKSSGRYYVGQTSDVEARLHAHNAGKVRSTKAYRPGVVVYSERLETKHAAYLRER